jgi:hypothetical protein
MPAVPGPGFVMVQSKLGLGDLEAILDRPAVTLHRDQRLNRGAGWTPGREVGHLAVADAAPDQEAAGPDATQVWVERLCRKIGQLQIRPLIQPRPLVPSPAERRRQADGFSPPARSSAVPLMTGLRSHA